MGIRRGAFFNLVEWVCGRNRLGSTSKHRLRRMPKAVPNGITDEVFAEATRKPNNPAFSATTLALMRITACFFTRSYRWSYPVKHDYAMPALAQSVMLRSPHHFECPKSRFITSGFSDYLGLRSSVELSTRGSAKALPSLYHLCLSCSFRASSISAAELNSPV
jgi:hypothetical protein